MEGGLDWERSRSARLLWKIYEKIVGSLGGKAGERRIYDKKITKWRVKSYCLHKNFGRELEDFIIDERQKSS